MAVSETLTQTAAAAASFLDSLRSATAGRTAAAIVGLSGDLGSGKTTFIQGLAQALGVSEPLTSPTFVIEKVYRLDDPDFSRLVHIDAYRLSGGSELRPLGWERLIADQKNLIVIEWPERIADALPPQTITVSFTFLDETRRKIETPFT
jgi:tRNA threonylcarbamoyladenosine biosynthesis protein TsaE